MFKELKGEIIVCFTINDAKDEIFIETDSGKAYKMLHHQDSQEVVSIKDICGDIKDILYSEILLAEELTSTDKNNTDEDMWVFYNLSTIKGSISIQWYGRCYDYDSMAVSCVETDTREETIVKLNDRLDRQRIECIQARDVSKLVDTQKDELIEKEKIIKHLKDNLNLYFKVKVLMAEILCN